MLFPIQNLIEGGDELLCAQKDTKLSDALALMMEHDYSQLPDVDDRGNLVGVVSEDSIISTYYHSGGLVSLLDLTVDHCLKPAVTLPPESDIFEALDSLKNVHAIVIVKEQKPVGILTDYDTTHFFRDLSEGLILVEDIEVTLRQYIEGAFPTDNEMQAALMRAFRHDRREPTRPAFEYEELSFGQHVQLIVTEENWSKLEDVFGPKDLFAQLMSNVGDARNQLAHFRGRLDALQHDALLRARDWLAVRPKLTLHKGVEQQPVRVAARAFLVKKGVGRYEPMEQWLVQQKEGARDIRVSFDDLERVLGDELPASAREHRSWWANDPDSHTQALAWMRAGWRVEDVDLATGTVSFKRTDTVLQQLFFADLLARLKKARPGVTRATKTFPASWWGFGAGKAGVNLNWTLRRENTLWVELYIDTGDKANNKAIYDKLAEQKDAVEQEIGLALNWDRLDGHKASRIFLSRPAKITDPPERLEQTKQWAIETALKLVDAFRPRIKEL